MRRVLGLSTAILVGMTTLASLQASAQETLKIGVVSALEGPGSEWGRGVDGGTKIAAKEINDKGGLKVGDKTYKIEVISYDDGYKAARGLAAATRLIEQDRVKFILGPLGSASALAVKPAVEGAKVVALMNSYSPQTLEGVNYVYRVLPTTAEFAEPIVSWIKKNHPTAKKVAVVSPNDQTGWDSQKIQVDTYQRQGFNIVSKELFERSTRDFQSLLTRLIAQSPDIIELDTTPPGTAGLIIRQARELGYKGMFSKIGGPGVPDIVAAAGANNAEGTVVYVAADVNNPKYKWLSDEYAKIYKPPMNAFNVFFYDAAHMLFKAMQTAGTVSDTAKVKDALTKVTPFKGMQGDLIWGGKELYGNNHQIQGPTFIGVIKNGQEVLVDTIQAKK